MIQDIDGKQYYNIICPNCKLTNLIEFIESLNIKELRCKNCDIRISEYSTLKDNCQNCDKLFLKSQLRQEDNLLMCKKCQDLTIEYRRLGLK